LQPNPQEQEETRLTLEEALNEWYESQQMVLRVEASHELDYDGTRRRLADRQMMKLRANMLANKATTNGNGNANHIRR
jgi:hypothetical protein